MGCEFLRLIDQRIQFARDSDFADKRLRIREFRFRLQRGGRSVWKCMGGNPKWEFLSDGVRRRGLSRSDSDFGWRGTEAARDQAMSGPSCDASAMDR